MLVARASSTIYAILNNFGSKKENGLRRMLITNQVPFWSDFAPQLIKN